jgi:hypothetical protein
MKGIEDWNYIIAAVLIGLASIAFVIYQMKTASLERAESERIANSIALHINSLTSVEKGSVTMEFNKLYDIKIKKKGELYTVKVTPYKENGERGDTAQAESIGEVEETELISVGAIILIKEPETKVRIEEA